MKSRYIYITLLLIPSLIVLSCVKNDLEELEKNEKRIIQNYLATNNIPENSRTEGGIYFVEKKTGTGLSPVKDDYVIINYVGRYLEDGSIRETSYDSLKSQWPILEKLTNYLFGPAKILYGYSMPGINEALSLMKEGGKALAVIPSDLANYDYRPLSYEIELIKVIRGISRFEDSVANIYSSQHYGSGSQIDTLGIWVRIDAAPSTENVFGTGDSLFFNYTGKIVDGFRDPITATRVIESNSGSAPVKYIHGQSRLTSGTMLEANLLKGLKTAFDSTVITNGMKFSVLLKYDQAWDKAGKLSLQKYFIVPVYNNVEYSFEVTAIRPQ